MRDKNFIISSIKMDLYRVVTAAGNISKTLPRESIKEFLQHALKDFDKIELTEHEQDMKNLLANLSNKLDQLEDPHRRLRWAEDILTLRCRI